MRHIQCRQFGLLDAMILVAATALGCGLVKWSGIVPLKGLEKVPFPNGYVLIILAAAKTIGPPLLTSWTLALLFARIRSPRPTRRQLFREPGIVATSTSTLAIVTGFLWFSGTRFVVDHPTLSAAFDGLTYFCAFAVAGGWLTLALSGRWRNRPGWMDHAGRLVGTTWMGLAICDWTYPILGFLSISN